MVNAICTVCETPFEAIRDTAKYCGNACRQVAYRNPDARSDKSAQELAQESNLPKDATTEKPYELYTTTARELRAVKRYDTSAGQAALALAYRIDGGGRKQAETGMSLAALVKEYRAAMEDAMSGAVTETDEVDEIGQRRETKLRNLG